MGSTPEQKPGAGREPEATESTPNVTRYAKMLAEAQGSKMGMALAIAEMMMNEGKDGPTGQLAAATCHLG